MSEGKRIPHNAALRVAERAFDLLGGCYERAAVAGSLRHGDQWCAEHERLFVERYRGRDEAPAR